MDHSIRPLTDDEAQRKRKQDEQFAAFDRQYNVEKTDPAAMAGREHKALTRQQQMLRMSGIEA